MKDFRKLAFVGLVGLGLAAVGSRRLQQQQRRTGTGGYDGHRPARRNGDRTGTGGTDAGTGGAGGGATTVAAVCGTTTPPAAALITDFSDASMPTAAPRSPSAAAHGPGRRRDVQ